MKLFTFLIIFLFAVAGNSDVFGQKTSGQKRPRTNGKTEAKPESIARKTDKTEADKSDSVIITEKPETLPPPPEPVSTKTGSITLNNSRRADETREKLADDIESATVTKVTENANTIIQVFLAEHGVSLIEFPSGDPIYAIHPGDENFVTIDCQQSGSSSVCANSPGDAIVLRPGKLFSQWQSEPKAVATVITIQRVSGKVVSFIVYPTKLITQNTFHIVVRYDLDEVVDSRLRAGLAVNLNKDLGITPGKSNSGTTPPGSDQKSAEFAKVGFSEQMTDEVSNSSSVGDSGLLDRLENSVLTRLKSVASSNQKLYFSKPHYGISLAITESDRTSDYTVEIIAVRNTTDKPLRLVPDQPELFIENRDAKEKTSVMQERIPILYIATTAAADDVLLPGQVYYFGIAYKQPILGSKQILRLAVAGRDAADQPALAALTKLNR